MNKVMVVRVPGDPELGVMEQIRDYTIASLAAGVFVIGAKWEHAMLDVGEICGVIVGDAEAAQAPEEEDPQGTVKFAGKGAAEKRRIYNRLLEWRCANGLGCLAQLAAPLGVTDDYLRRAMLGSVTLDLNEWLRVDAALDAVCADNK